MTGLGDVSGAAPRTMDYCVTDSPVGSLLLAGEDGALSMLEFQRGRRAARSPQDWREDRKPFRDALSQLEAYFAGRLRRFELRLAPAGTRFQHQVWDLLLEIPYGETRSYGELARRIGDPKAARAVGLANGSNPIAIVIPCHRVIGANGKLTGYGGGLDVKRQLLALERGPGLFD
jgi:methylated-DNA-[protein]-cysteine S-methyltransferase